MKNEFLKTSFRIHFAFSILRKHSTTRGQKLPWIGDYWIILVVLNSNLICLLPGITFMQYAANTLTSHLLVSSSKTSRQLPHSPASEIFFSDYIPSEQV